MSHRSFPKEIESIAKLWSSSACTHETWQNLGPFGGTESQPFRVQNGNLIGLAKPGPGASNPDMPRAAHEKIAADLAYHLGLPVPPVTLLDRGSSTPVARFVAISAWAFPGAEDWTKIAHLLPAAAMESASRVFSAMLPFEAWIGATDRKPDHVLAALDAGTGELRLAFIDYAFSMVYNWRTVDASYGRITRYMPLQINGDALRQSMAAIETMSDYLVSTLVDRIPASFLPEAKREVIISNLRRRKKRLAAIAGTT